MKIIFRGMTESGVWFCGDLLTDYSSNSKHTIRYDNTIYKDVIPETVGQCTGLKDKNGEEIWVGDILEFTNLKEWGGNKRVFREVKSVLRMLEDFCESDLKSYWEIIGNIHDNPELLKGE